MRSLQSCKFKSMCGVITSARSVTWSSRCLSESRKNTERECAIRWRAFELRPEPAPTLKPDGAYLRDIWARAVYPMAKERGMTLRLPPMQPRSRLAHESALFAATQGLFDAMNTALFKAFFEDGRDIGDPVELVEIGASIGLNAAELRQALSEGFHRKSVLADQELARKLAISGVPALLIHHEERAA